MKKLFIITSLLIGTITFGQKVNKNFGGEPKKEADRIYKILDSVSKVYKKNIVMFDHTIIGNTESVHFKYYKNDKLRDTTIIVVKPPLKN
ncbi:MAG: hypothetical protein ACOYOR_06565 [Flavobacterium psychrophilum]